MANNPVSGQPSEVLNPSGGGADWLRMEVLDTVSGGGQNTDDEDSGVVPPRATRQFGNYEIIGVLGEGGSGIVYHARQPGVEREVAIKALSRGVFSTPTTRERFEAELRILGKLRHNNIVQIHDADVHGEVPYLVMEYVSGGTLSRLIHEQGVPVRRAAALMIEVAGAVHEAHQQGVLHRDLKPGNILLTADGQPKVADFGTALDVDQPDRLTQTGARIGTAAYMAPERLTESKHSTAACDIYSLGVVLHELLTGVLPFEGNSLEAALLQIVSRDPLPLQTWSPRLPLELDTICRKCLQKEPDRRYQTAEDLADDLQRFLDDRPITARPARWPEKTVRWCRREPVRAGLAAGLLAIVLVTLFGLTWGLSVVADVNADLTTANSNLQDSVIELSAARERTETEKQRAERTLSFMVDSFRRPDPRQSGRILTVFELMETASRKLGAEQTLDPPFRRSLLQAIGKTFIGLGENAAAVGVLERADKVITDYLDPDALESLETRHDLALAYRRTGRYLDSLSLNESVHRRKTEVLGVDHASTLRTATNLATVFLILDRTAESIDLFERTLSKQRQFLGDEHLDTLTTFNDLAGAYRSIQRYEDAMRLFRLAADGMTKLLGPDHPETLTAVGNAAIIHLDIDQPADAIPLFERVLASRRERLGNNHPDTAITLSSLGNAHYRNRDYAKAIEFYSETRSWYQQNNGPEHWRTLHATSSLAEMHRLDGNHSESIALNEFVLEIRLQKIGPEHKHTLLTKNNLAAAYMNAGRTEEAVELLEQVYKARVKILGEDAPDTIRMLLKLETAKRCDTIPRQSGETDGLPRNTPSDRNK
jgi:eukaryotic-like serine/threonine-protein kinase